ncbi:HAMP domain-containing sensor histidine kinase [Atopococcus tabaci]|uniref:HAMP domain-containing sensor histidine kinase n=1 Tax=Atopococcus tabaci TaxID=269774 RepID=UPI002409A398|nr:HAMP domain-containing histidine kinase [Atopococcus tabaci]
MREKQTPKDESKKERRRVSLKWKWTIGAAGAIFLTYTLFASLLYFGFRQIFLENETQNVRDMTVEITERLMLNSASLTSADVEQVLSPETSVPPDVFYGNVPVGETNPYPDSLFSQISEEGVAVKVYDEENHLVYESAPSDLPFSPSERFRIETVEGTDGLSLAATAPVYSTMDNQLIGYVYVTDGLVGFHQLVQRIFLATIITGILALALSAVLGYVLAANFLKPIRKITDGMKAIRKDPESRERIEHKGGNDELTDLTNAYNDMLDRMQRNIEQQKQFVEDVSHELRTPVAVVEGHLKLLNRWGKDDPEILDESLGASLQEIERMKNLVQEMLDLSRAEQVEIHYKNERTPVKEVVQQTYNNFKMLRPDFVFILDDDIDDDIFVNIYRNHLEQILVILMDNAVKYSTDRKEVHISVALEQDRVELAVQDYGEGMSEEDTEKIFNRFYRVDKARSRHKGGNGLGLAIARELIQGYGGKIWAESVLNHGSIFRVVLPVLKEPADQEEIQEPE